MEETAKSGIDEIRERFDKDVERFSNLDSGQVSTMDAAYCMDLISDAARAVCPQAQTVLDIGCGAGNYSIKVARALPGCHFTLIDLSNNMLDRARERLSRENIAGLECISADVRTLNLGIEQYDIILATAVLHHLRNEKEWLATFSNIYQSLRPGGVLLVFDLVLDGHAALNSLSWKIYGKYLEDLKGAEYRDHVFAYIEREDSPASLEFQLHTLKEVGFSQVDVLHKHACFAAYAAMKGK